MTQPSFFDGDDFFVEKVFLSDAIPDTTSIIPKSLRSMISFIIEESREPRSAPRIPKPAIVRTAVPSICRFERCIQTALPEEKMKKSRFIPWAVICGVSVNIARKTTKSPPPPTPIPEITPVAAPTNTPHHQLIAPAPP